jgi:hypothetical protein
VCVSREGCGLPGPSRAGERWRASSQLGRACRGTVRPARGPADPPASWSRALNGRWVVALPRLLPLSCAAGYFCSSAAGRGACTGASPRAVRARGPLSRNTRRSVSSVFLFSCGRRLAWSECIGRVAAHPAGQSWRIALHRCLRDQVGRQSFGGSLISESAHHDKNRTTEPDPSSPRQSVYSHTPSSPG